MKRLLFLFLAASPLFAANVSAIALPSYLAAGCAFNQLAGFNCWGTAVVPVLKAGGYESTTIDVFPARVQVNGKSVYILHTSVREGGHWVLIDDGKNVFLAGADAGFSFAQASAAGAAASGVSAAITLTYVRRLNDSWAFMVPIRALYMSSLGGWNPIIEAGIVYTPRKK